MQEQPDPHQEQGVQSGEAGENQMQRLFDEAQNEQLESEASPEQLRQAREEVAVTFLNTSFSGAFDHPEGLDDLLLQDGEPLANSVFAFSEVTHPQRVAVAQALAQRGFQVVLPPDDSHLDLAYAVGPGLEVEDNDVHHFPRNGIRKIASRTGSEKYRHVGVQDLTITTANGNRIRLGHQRLSPMLVEPVRRKQIKDLANVLSEQYPPSEDVTLTINGGDMNHIRPFRRPDDRMWAKQPGWEPVLEKGTPTHTSADKYSKYDKVFRALGRKSSETQLDAAYARPGNGMALVDTASTSQDDLNADQIGYKTEIKAVEGTDHYAVKTTYSLPKASRPTKTERLS